MMIVLVINNGYSSLHVTEETFSFFLVPIIPPKYVIYSRKCARKIRLTITVQMPAFRNNVSYCPFVVIVANPYCLLNGCLMSAYCLLIVCYYWLLL